MNPRHRREAGAGKRGQRACQGASPERSCGRSAGESRSSPPRGRGGGRFHQRVRRPGVRRPVARAPSGGSHCGRGRRRPLRRPAPAGAAEAAHGCRPCWSCSEPKSRLSLPRHRGVGADRIAGAPGAPPSPRRAHDQGPGCRHHARRRRCACRLPNPVAPKVYFFRGGIFTSIF